MNRAATGPDIPILTGIGLTPVRFLTRMILTPLLFGMAGPIGLIHIPLVFFVYLGYLVKVNKPVFQAFHAQEASEWLLGLAFSRRGLAFRYVSAILLRSMVHTIGAAVGMAVFWVDNPEEFARPMRDILVFNFTFQVIFQCIVAILRHLECCTWVPARWRSLLLGSKVSRWQWVSALSALSVLVILILVFPVVFYQEFGPTWWQALPTAGYLALTFGMAATSEASRRGNADMTDLLRSAPDLSTSRVQPLRAAPHRYAPLTTLCWNGLTPWVKQAAWLCPLLSVITVAIWVLIIRLEYAAGPDLHQHTWLLLEVGILLAPGIIVFLYLINGCQIFEWRPVGPTADYLYMRGVRLGKLRRLTLLSGMLVTGLVFAYSVFTLLLFDRLALLTHLGQRYWGILLVPTGLLLLFVNEQPIGWRAVRARHLAVLLLPLLPVLFLIAIFLAAANRDFAFLFTSAPFWNVIGLSVFLPAMALWLRGWRASANEQRVRWDTWEA